jgi:hypothetical protein
MRKPYHSYSVFLVSADDLLVMRYMGSSERAAAWHYYKVVTDPRAAVAILRKDGQLVARTQVRVLERQQA